MLHTTYTANKRISWGELLLPWRIWIHLQHQAELIGQFTVRDVVGRYRGSYLGILWSLLRPLSMLAMFTVIFGYIFESKLGSHPNETKLDFTLALFCGLILFDFFAECVARAPTLVISNPNYVKKVVFPLEILPVVTVGAAFIQLAISFIPLFLGWMCMHGSIPMAALYLPVLLVPIIFLCLGITWLLASLGVFIRDINSMVPVVLTIVMYASAIFYSIDKVPPHFLPIVRYNPLAVVIEQTRNAILWGMQPDWGGYVFMLVTGLIAAVLGYAFFMRTKNAFADVI